MIRFLLIISIFFVGISTISAQSDGPLAPSTSTSAGNGAGWSNLSGILAIDNNPAYVDMAQFPVCNSFMCYYSNSAEFSGFGFNIPLTATVSGIQLEIMQRVSSPGGGIRDSSLVLTLNGTRLSADYARSAYWTDTPTMNYYGDSTDTWAYSWTPAQINDPGFGFSYRLTNDSYDQPASVDYLRMTVYYQTGTGVHAQTNEGVKIGFVNNTLHISTASFVIKSVRVWDLTGRLRYSSDQASASTNPELIIDSQNWSHGIYLLELNNAEGNSVLQKALLVK